MCKAAVALGGALAVGALLGGCATRERASLAQLHRGSGMVATQLRDGTDRGVVFAPDVVQGTVIGGSIGPRMDTQDRRVAGLALSDNATRQATRWYNADTGIRYVLVPMDGFEGPEGPCRYFNMVASASGRLQFGDGLACRQSDGRWIETR